MTRMHAGLTADRSVTVTCGETTLFRYVFGGPHPHLTGLTTRGGAELPGMITWTPPHADPGRAVHRVMTELSTAGSQATIAHRLSWSAVDEWRCLTASVTGNDTWLLLFENTVTNVSGRALPLAGPSLSLRAIAAPSAARSEWQAALLSDFTLVVVDDAANLAHPPRWSAGLTPAPFDSGHRTLGIDQTIAFRYAVIVAPASQDARLAPELAALGQDALAGLPTAVRGDLCSGEHTRRGPAHRTRTRVLTRQCVGGTPPVP